LAAATIALKPHSADQEQSMSQSLPRFGTRVVSSHSRERSSVARRSGVSSRDRRAMNARPFAASWKAW
jgi:hypothetical protein